MKRICVFCGSSQGSGPEYRDAAEELAAELVRRNIGLVYGGGNVGGKPAAGETATWYQIGYHRCLFLPQIAYSNCRKVAETIDFRSWTVEQ